MSKERYDNQEKLEIISAGDDVFVRNSPDIMMTSPVYKVSEVIIEGGLLKAISLVGSSKGLRRSFTEGDNIYISKSRTEQVHILKVKLIEDNSDGSGVLKAEEF